MRALVRCPCRKAKRLYSLFTELTAAPRVVRGPSRFSGTSVCRPRVARTENRKQNCSFETLGAAGKRKQSALSCGSPCSRDFWRWLLSQFTNT